MCRKQMNQKPEEDRLGLGVQEGGRTTGLSTFPSDHLGCIEKKDLMKKAPASIQPHFPDIAISPALGFQICRSIGGEID